jgi:hypothetical protein
VFKNYVRGGQRVGKEKRKSLAIEEKKREKNKNWGRID